MVLKVIFVVSVNDDVCDEFIVDFGLFLVLKLLESLFLWGVYKVEIKDVLKIWFK